MHPRRPSPLVLVLLLAALLAAAPSLAGEDEVKPEEKEEKPVNADAAPPETPEPKLEVATFGGGCFWCTEAIYERIEGVASVESGYAGGHVANPTYEAVCAGTTGHAECIQLRYDPEKVGYVDLLKVFFATHDPTTLNRQGADVGTQYRSVIFFHDEKQEEAAKKVVAELKEAEVYDDPIVTEITPFDAFFPAEEKHQEYFARNPKQGYCRVVIRPKVEKFEKAFAKLLKKPDDEKKEAPEGEDAKAKSDAAPRTEGS